MITADDQIVLRLAIHGYALLNKRKRLSRRDLEFVTDTEYRVEDGLQIMVTIFSLAYDTQTYIDFAVRIDNHPRQAIIL